MYVFKVITSLQINKTNIESFNTNSIQYLYNYTVCTNKKQLIFALSLKNSSIRYTRHLKLQYLTHPNTQITKYSTQKAQTVLEIFFVFEVITSLKKIKTNIETFYTNSVQYLYNCTVHIYKKQQIFSLSFKNSSIQDTMV